MIRFKTPNFWYDTITPQARLIALCLTPLSWLYNTGRKLHQSLPSTVHRSPIPVLCIGNLTAGGSGKTPTALAVMNLIRTNNLAQNPVFLTRGYGGRIKTPTLVDPSHHTAHDTGDEALLLAQAAPTIVSPDRAAGAGFAAQNGFDLIVMDDGFQNRSLAKTLSLVVIDGASGFGNGRLIPAGALREPVTEGTRRADGFVLIGDNAHNIRAQLPPDKPVFKAQITVPKTWIADTKSSYIAFCGLGRPEKFKRTLERQNIKIAARLEFPDHHAFTPADLDKLIQTALNHKARLITTEKDALRLPPTFATQHPLDILPIELVFSEPDELATFIAQKIKP